MTRADEHLLASWAARPGWPHIRALLIGLGLDVSPLDEVISRVRREVWRDFSSSRDHAQAASVVLERETA